MTDDSESLIDFLAARIADDKAVVAHYVEHSGSVDSTDEDGLSWWGEYAHLSISPARVLAWCEARERILEVARPWVVENTRRKGRNTDIRIVAEEYERTLRALALSDAHHKDYQESWTP